jgi:hypothetical protein
MSVAMRTYDIVVQVKLAVEAESQKQAEVHAYKYVAGEMPDGVIVRSPWRAETVKMGPAWVVEDEDDGPQEDGPEARGRLTGEDR